jgi:hypothetical protein
MELVAAADCTAWGRRSRLTFVRHFLAAPQRANDVHCFRQPVPPLPPFWPGAGRRLFVERFAGSDAEKNPARVEMAQRRERLGPSRPGYNAGSGRSPSFPSMPERPGSSPMSTPGEFNGGDRGGFPPNAGDQGTMGNPQRRKGNSSEAPLVAAVAKEMGEHSPRKSS